MEDNSMRNSTETREDDNEGAIEMLVNGGGQTRSEVETGGG